MALDVALIEDDASIREMLADWINHTPGCRCVSHHGTAASALADLPAAKPAIALVDINLPDLSGIECVRRLKPVLPETQFLMLTVYEDSEHIFKALEVGAIGYLLKPIPCAKLVAALRQIQQGGAPMTGYIARKVVQSFQTTRQENVLTATLSARERDVLTFLSEGYFYKEIADTMGVKISSVNTFVMRIYRKLHVHSRGQAVAKLRLGEAAATQSALEAK